MCHPQGSARPSDAPLLWCLPFERPSPATPSLCPKHSQPPLAWPLLDARSGRGIKAQPLFLGNPSPKPSLPETRQWKASGGEGDGDIARTCVAAWSSRGFWWRTSHQPFPFPRWPPTGAKSGALRALPHGSRNKVKVSLERNCGGQGS